MECEVDMDVSALKAKIKSKQIPHYLIFTGPEWKVQQIYIEQIAKVTKSEAVHIDSIKDIASTMRSKAFLSVSKAFIVRDDTELLQADSNVIQSITDSLKGNFLIHILTSVDKRKKYYKENQDRIVDFQPLSDSALKKYIKREINLSDNNCQRLIEVCEHSYGRILLEIDKIERYRDFDVYSDDHMADKAFEQLIKDGTIYQPPYDAIFDLVDAILDRKPQKSFDLLRQAYEVGEATMVMLSVLFTNAKNLLQVQAYHGDNLSKSSGLSGWEIKNAKKHIGKYSVPELTKMLKKVQSVEIGIKTGKIEEEVAMEYLLCQIL